ncbi:aminotransferase class I/II-fold pyridoxal phosphate-dependent enzyme [Methanosarcina sp. WWM596]|uniref:aminotransferase class I/II-fold pyridoxal phosphate-dependent enzyme n=1 Tax=Methanosarcina sp. WWM596 TaxID=1434103 RepID=UPI000615B5A9|nr:aminotransferase class I/II-fold pyridoxal phosphate-dependent enzyme [Methanosarcina sp. WWM596]AKB17738.1 Phosphocholine cytidylyltransferase [Methanosarcina sp. WWM596]
MQAIILAAGMGKRLGELTKNNTKCMISVHGKTLIEKTLDILEKTEVKRVILVIGYQGEKLKKFIGSSYKGLEIIYVENEIYYKTNNIYSLYLASDYLIEDDTLLLESDLIFDEKIIFDLIAHPFPNLAVVSKYESWMDGTVVTIDKDDNIVRFIPKKHFKYQEISDYYKTVNIYKFSKAFSLESYVPFLKAYSSAIGNNEYYEQVLRVIVSLEKQDLKAYKLSAEKWYEIDDIQDLNNAETVFGTENNKLELFQKRYGGYWRFPHLKDFCYLVNPYFPNDTMQNEMKCYFYDLLSQYPSGLDIQNILASKMFGCHSNQIIVGNGAAELINSLLTISNGTVGVIYPTFNEYPERVQANKLKTMYPKNENFSYSAKDLQKFSHDIDNLILINPDNPSGNFIPVEDVIELADHLRKNNKKLILDESFVDFTSKGATNSLIHKDLLNENPNMIVIKSISKSYGVPGIRLGVMATSDSELLCRVKKNISIWNINSFAEFFLQIIGKYEGEYIEACNKIASERDRFYGKLCKVPFLRVIPSQANYFLCEVKGKFSSTELTDLLLRKYDIFIKDCKGKAGFDNKNYVRIAVRDFDDNEYLTEILHSI